MSATALSEAIASGSISCVETMQAFLTQIEATNPAVNALINLDPPEHCLALAAKADELPEQFGRQRRANRRRGRVGRRGPRRAAPPSASAAAW